jgi:hypothetical membrane protein
MFGLLAFLVAALLAMVGPRFLWRGAALLAVAGIAVGVFATLAAQHEARAAGLHFGFSIISVVMGLALQAVFMLTMYSLTAGAMRLFKFSRRSKPRPPS